MGCWVLLAGCAGLAFIAAHRPPGRHRRPGAGDNVGTATAIAQECGILPPAGASLEDWSAAHAAAKDATRAGVGWFRDDPSSSIVSPQQKKGEGSLASRSSLLASVGSLDAHRPACGEAGGEACGHGGLPEGVVMEGAEFRERVLNPDGSINAGEQGRASGPAPLPSPLHATPLRRPCGGPCCCAPCCGPHQCRGPLWLSPACLRRRLHPCR